MFEPFVMNIDVPVVVEGFLACVQRIERLSRERFHGNYDGRHGERKKEREGVNSSFSISVSLIFFQDRKRKRAGRERERERRTDGHDDEKMMIER